MITDNTKAAATRIGFPGEENERATADREEMVASELARLAVIFVEPPPVEWVSSITLPRGFLGRERVEAVEVVLGIRPPEVPGELVRININIPDDIVTGFRLRSLIRQHLPPFIEGIGNLRAEDSAQGVVLLLVDDLYVDDRY